MEVGQGGVKSALDEIHEKYGFEGKAIVTMEEVVEHLYNRECQGRIVIDDTIKKAIDAYYDSMDANKQKGCRISRDGAVWKLVGLITRRSYEIHR